MMFAAPVRPYLFMELHILHRGVTNDTYICSYLGGEVGSPNSMRPKGGSKQGVLKRERERASPAGSGPSLLAKRRGSAEKRKLPQKQQRRGRGGSPSPSSSSEDGDEESEDDEAEEEASSGSSGSDDGDDGVSAGGVVNDRVKRKSPEGAMMNRATANGASRARGSSRRGGSSSAVAAVATALAESDVVPLRPRAARQLPDDDEATTVAGKAAVKGAAKDAGRSKESGKAAQQRGVKQPASGPTLAPKPLSSSAPLGQKENVSSAKAIEILGLHKVISIRLRHPNIPVLQQKT